MPDKKEKTLGVNDLAKHLKKEPATVRVLLREAKIKKDGKSYSWTSKGAMEAVAKKLGGSPAPAKKKAKPERAATAAA